MGGGEGRMGTVEKGGVEKGTEKRWKIEKVGTEVGTEREEWRDGGGKGEGCMDEWKEGGN